MRRVLLLLPTLFWALSSHAEVSNFRVGLGWLNVDIHPSELAKKQDNGMSLFAEFPQSNYTASRFLVYRLNGEDDLRLHGFETQLMWGYGLAKSGLRVYTGPAWHHETWNTANQSQRFNGWGWQLGTGFQHRAITMDIAATYRQPSDYHRFNRRQGIRQQPDPILANLLVSYRF